MQKPHNVDTAGIVNDSGGGSIGLDGGRHRDRNNNYDNSDACFFQQTVMAVLSCMMDPIGQSSSVRVHYHVLDADENGRSPRHEHFKVNSKSCLHLISKGHYMVRSMKDGDG